MDNVCDIGFESCLYKLANAIKHSLKKSSDILLKIVSLRNEAVQKADSEDADLRLKRYVEDYSTSILRMAYTYLHNIQDSEEVVQDTLVKLIEKAPVFENKNHEKAYILKVASNLSKNRITYNKLRDTDELKEEFTKTGVEDLSFVWDAVRSLPEKYRAVIHLFYHENYSTAEIADILEKKESTVRSYLKRARERLKIILKEEYDFEQV